MHPIVVAIIGYVVLAGLAIWLIWKFHKNKENRRAYWGNAAVIFILGLVLVFLLIPGIFFSGTTSLGPDTQGYQTHSISLAEQKAGAWFPFLNLSETQTETFSFSVYYDSLENLEKNGHEKDVKAEYRQKDGKTWTVKGFPEPDPESRQAFVSGKELSYRYEAGPTSSVCFLFFTWQEKPYSLELQTPSVLSEEEMLLEMRAVLPKD